MNREVMEAEDLWPDRAALHEFRSARPCISASPVPDPELTATCCTHRLTVRLAVS